MVGLACLAILPEFTYRAGASVTVFFATITILLLLEVIWHIRRDFADRLEFVEDESGA
jgi:predicted small integral membrane protein